MNIQAEKQHLSFEDEIESSSDIDIEALVPKSEIYFDKWPSEFVKYYTISKVPSARRRCLWQGLTHETLVASAVASGVTHAAILDLSARPRLVVESAVASGVTHAIPYLVDRSRLVKNILKPAKDEMTSFLNANLVSNAYAFLDKLYDALMEHEVKNLQSLNAFEDEECIVLEWIDQNWRIGFALDINPEESSWFLVSNKAAGDVMASGNLSSVDINWIVYWLITRNH